MGAIEQEVPMSPVVIVGFGAIDAALFGQAVYAYTDYHRRSAVKSRRAAQQPRKARN